MCWYTHNHRRQVVKVDLPGGSQVASEEPHASLLSSPSLAASTSTAGCVIRGEGQHHSAMLYIHKPTKVMFALSDKLAVCINHDVTEHINKPIHTPCAVLLSNPQTYRLLRLVQLLWRQSTGVKAGGFGVKVQVPSLQDFLGSSIPGTRGWNQRSVYTACVTFVAQSTLGVTWSAHISTRK